MSADAEAFVWKQSPYRGTAMLIHLAIADVVNDTHQNRFWMSAESLAKKCRVSRSSANAALADMVERGYLKKLTVGGGRSITTEYQFVGETVQSTKETVQSTAVNCPVVDIELNRTQEQLLQAESVQKLDSLQSEPKEPAPWVVEGISRKEWNEHLRAKEAGA